MIGSPRCSHKRRNIQPDILHADTQGQSEPVFVLVHLLGKDSAEFKAVSNCGSIISPGGSCNVNIRFQPSAEGDKTANLTVSATGAVPKAVALIGTASRPDFVLAPLAGSSTATVPAGQPASFDFSVGQHGAFTGTIAMTCTNLTQRTMHAILKFL